MILVFSNVCLVGRIKRHIKSRAYHFAWMVCSFSIWICFLYWNFASTYFCFELVGFPSRARGWGDTFLFGCKLLKITFFFLLVRFISQLAMVRMEGNNPKVEGWNIICLVKKSSRMETMVWISLRNTFVHHKKLELIIFC